MVGEGIVVEGTEVEGTAIGDAGVEEDESAGPGITGDVGALLDVAAVGIATGAVTAGTEAFRAACGALAEEAAADEELCAGTAAAEGAPATG